MSFLGQFFGGGPMGGRGPNGFGFDRRGPPPGHQQYNGQSVYQNFLRAFPADYLGRQDLDRGNKVLLPSAALAELGMLYVSNLSKWADAATISIQNKFNENKKDSLLRCSRICSA